MLEFFGDDVCEMTGDDKDRNWAVSDWTTGK